jgi:hypothetical protein
MADDARIVLPNINLGGLLDSILPTMPNLIPLPPSGNALLESVEENYASAFHSRLKVLIERFDESLDEGHEVGIRLVSFGQAITFHLANVGYCNPSLMFFSGVTEDGNPVELIQHVSQISVLLMKVKRLDPTKPKPKIGFTADALPSDQPHP